MSRKSTETEAEVSEVEVEEAETVAPEGVSADEARDVQGVGGDATSESDLSAAEVLLLAVKAATPAEHDRLMAVRSEKLSKE